ncbi:MAG: zinc ribbon domain-containing protein, partial [Anaerolineae bacterium]
MPVWCPKCHAMLADGTAKCPRCGAKLPKAPSDPNAFTPQEFKAILLEAYKFALLPVA